ncbi:hypothetical protein HDV05_005483 [Chytridiales sp. JEL 0842]|nr:hypothetical protein HDV05_005483 [Chytridiales sp. JEL 0842]
MKASIIASTILFVAGSVSIQAQSIDINNYPARYQPPPSNPEWNARYLSNFNPNDPAQEILSCSSSLPSRTWALTFDDGPSEPWTTQILNTLAASNAKATFFVVGSQAIMHPDVLRRVYAAGHQIASHSWSHTDLATLSNEQVLSEILWTQRAIQDIIGVAPRFIRTPYGSRDARIRSIFKSVGLEHVYWNADTNDWMDGNMSPKFSSWSNGGGLGNPVSLQHDIHRTTAEGMGAVMEALRGWRFVSVAECLGERPYL